MRLWNVKTRIRALGLSLMTLFLTGVVGFVLIKTYVEGEHVTFVEAMYWTIITLTTLGYYPPGVGLTSDIGMAFTILIVGSGVIIIFVGVPSVVAPWFEERLQRATKARKTPLPEGGHIVVVGYNPTSRYAIEELRHHGFASVVVDEDREHEQELLEKGVPFVWGDPTDEETLKKARLDTSLGLMLTGQDDVNIFAAITARKVNPEVHIVSIARDPEKEKLLYKIGVNKVVSPGSFVGRMLANRALGRYEADIIEGKKLLGGLEMRQYTLTPRSGITGKTLAESGIGEKTGILVIGVWREGELTVTPQPDFVFKEGDIVVIMGTSAQMLAFENTFGGIAG